MAALIFLLPATFAYAQSSDTLVTVRDDARNLRMSLHKNGGLYIGGEYTGDPSGNSIVATGAGTRMMWYPERAAFRAGYVNATQWDADWIGDYSVAMGYGTRASGTNATAFGFGCTAAQASAFAAGESNTASGAASVALGYHAHTNARQGSFVFSDRSSIDTLRAGVNHSANWRTSGGFRIFSSSNLSTGVTLQSGASVSNWGQANAVISTSTGAMLTTSGVWQNASDVNRKHLFEPVVSEEILQKLAGLEIQRWSYLVDDAKIKHIGPTAQDFQAAFGLGNDNLSIGTVDADGVALVAVQALEARTRKQATQLEKLESENKELRDRLDKLENRSVMSTANLPLTALLLGGIGLGGFLLRRRGTAFVTKK